MAAEAVALQFLLDKLASLVKGEIGLIKGVDEEIKKLSSTLTSIQAVLEDAENKQFESKQIQDWLCKLKNLINEIEDVLDEYATDVSILEHKNSKLNRYSLKKIQNRHKIARQVKEVTKKLDEVAAERANFHLNVMVVERQDKDATIRETGSILNEPDLVFGRDEEMEKIVDILVNDVRDSQQLSVLPILGIGGIGKTTLAQLVYNHPRVTKHFEKKLWVCVSDNFDVKTLVQTMLISAGREKTSDHLDTLQRALRDVLNQKKYLLILDDVWNEDQEKWAMLKSVIACGTRGASIVVTTRLKSSAGIMGTLPAHELSQLSEEHCWWLFKQRAFGQEAVEQHPNLEDIGRQIVKKCCGVPLAAKALGGLLHFKREEKEWVHVNQSEIWNLQTPILPALRLSYQHLPLQLRQCFAYFAIYPKDYEAEKEELIYCWMAHGYISSDGLMDVEDVGNRACNELVLRSLFQDVGTNKAGNITFKMHDLVHDLAQSIIMGNKVPGKEVASCDRSALNKNKIRQVNLKEQYVAFPRSFEEEVNISDTLKNFNRLRMLDASNTRMKDLSSKVGSLKHLRYINLSDSDFRTLPNTVCSLWNLQILNLNNCYRLVSLPRNMRNMKNLRHLFLEQCGKLRKTPPKIGELTSLKTWSVYIVSHKIDNQLDQLQNLDLGGKLEIKHLERVKHHMSAKKASLGEKSNLRGLVMKWKVKNASKQQQEMDEKVLEALQPHPNLEILKIWGFRGRYFPRWMRMENLIDICIKDCPNCLRLPPLGDLPRLKSLVLDNLASLEYVMEINQVKKDAILFPSLEELDLKSLPNLKGLLKDEDEEIGEVQIISPPKLQTEHHHLPMPITTEEGFQCFKTLKVLVIYNCDTLSDGWFRHLTALEKLYISSCSELVELPAEGMKSLQSSLKHFELIALPKMVCLPEAMQHFSTSLQSLMLWNLQQLTSLPEWLGNFTSLQDLNIEDCPQLTSLPASIKGMTNLKRLEINPHWNGEINPELKRRFAKRTGEDRHLISHIPFVNIDYDWLD